MKLFSVRNNLVSDFGLHSAGKTRFRLQPPKNARKSHGRGTPVFTVRQSVFLIARKNLNLQSHFAIIRFFYIQYKGDFPGFHIGKQGSKILHGSIGIAHALTTEKRTIDEPPIC